MSKKAEIILK